MEEILRIEELKPGMVVAQDTYSVDGKLLAPAGTILSLLGISHLSKCELEEVWVDQTQTTWLH